MALDMPGACRHRPVLVRNCIDYKSFWSNMLLRGTGITFGLSAIFILAAAICLAVRMPAIQLSTLLPPHPITLARRPVLGNPSAAKGPETSTPQLPKTLMKPVADPLNPVIERKFTVKKGDTLATVLRRAGVSHPDAHAAVRAFSKKYDPRYIRVGQELRIRCHGGGHSVGQIELGADGFDYSPAFNKEVRATRGSGLPSMPRLPTVR